MLDVLQGFVHELRLAGLPVSMTENLDAMRAVEHVPLDDREAFKTALGATLVKHHGHHKVFDTVFEVYFSIFSPGVDQDGEGSEGGSDAQADFEQLRIPVGEGALTTGGLIALSAAIVLGTLLAAVAGGKAGTHYHRKVDRAGAR